MRKRNVHIQFWLDKKEAEVFQKKVKRSGLSREAYLRHLVNGLEPQDAPPPDYYAMMRELHGIGNNLNQIAVKAHTLNVLDVQRYDEACRKIDTAVKKITEAVILPRPMESRYGDNFNLACERLARQGGDLCGEPRKDGKPEILRRPGTDRTGRAAAYRCDPLRRQFGKNAGNRQ